MLLVACTLTKWDGAVLDSPHRTAHYTSPSLGLLAGHAITPGQDNHPDFWGPNLKGGFQIGLYSLEARRYGSPKKGKIPSRWVCLGKEPDYPLSMKSFKDLGKQGLRHDIFSF